MSATPLPFRVGMIVAASENNVIGKGNTMPWRLSADLRYFKKRTMGKPVIMGRKTFESIGKALPGRQNIVVSRNPQFRADGVTCVDSLEAAFAACEPCEEVMIIGGAAIYALAMPVVDTVYLTRVHIDVSDGDTVIEPLQPEQWLTVCEHHLEGENGQPACTFFVFERR
ncbi:MAG: dihydrofolate reductase [Pseudomonadota bacterium]